MLLFLSRYGGKEGGVGEERGFNGCKCRRKSFSFFLFGCFMFEMRMRCVKEGGEDLRLKQFKGGGQS